jgi:DNA uptake protein ComE-like DNA-binding protein
MLITYVITALGILCCFAQEEQEQTTTPVAQEAVLSDGTTVQKKQAVEKAVEQPPKAEQPKEAGKPVQPPPEAATAPTPQKMAEEQRPADLRKTEISYPQAEQLLNINRATEDEIRKALNLSAEEARAIADYKTLHGPFMNVFEITNVPGIDTVIFNQKIKPNVKIIYRKSTDARREDRLNSAYNRLAYQQWNHTAVQDYLADYLKYPVDVNTLGFNELVNFPNVTPVGAAAIVNQRKEKGPLTYVGQLNRVNGLDYWGYVNLRDYVKVQGEKPRVKLLGLGALTDEMEQPGFMAKNNVYGNFRFTYEDWPTYTPVPAEWAIAVGTVPYVGGWPYLYSIPRVSYKLSTGCKDKIKFGFIGERPFSGRWGEYSPVYNYKGYLGFENYGIVKKVYLGNYYLSIGEGLVVNNGDDFMPRKADTVNGLYGDLSNSQELKFTGAATQLRYGKLEGYVFYSNDKKDVVMNKSSDTVSYYLFNRYGYSAAPGEQKGALLTAPLDNMSEQDYGIHLNFNPTDTSAIGLTHFVMDPEKTFDPYWGTVMARNLETDFIYGDYKGLYNAEYLQLYKGKVRRFYGTNFTYVKDNVSVGGEYARMQDADKSVLETSGRDAYLVNALVQFNNLYVKGIYRHYDLGYDNPYAKAFSESTRFYDNILKYNYKYADYYDGRYSTDEGDYSRPSLYYNMYDTPNMKPEDGLYLETRWQISYKWTLNRAFVDFWKQLGDDTLHLYSQAELEYRPVYEVRLTWKEKLRLKNIQYVRGNIHETTLRARARLSNRDSAEIRYFILRYEFGTRPDYERFHAETSYNDFIQARLTHNFNDNWGIENAFTLWSTSNYGYLWDFEDSAPLDFMNNNGYKYYFIVTDKLSQNTRLRFKTRIKTTIVDTDPTTKTRTGTEEVGGSVEKSDYSFLLQFDYDW